MPYFATSLFILIDSADTLLIMKQSAVLAAFLSSNGVTRKLYPPGEMSLQDAFAKLYNNAIDFAKPIGIQSGYGGKKFMKKNIITAAIIIFPNLLICATSPSPDAGKVNVNIDIPMSKESMYAVGCQAVCRDNNYDYRGYSISHWFNGKDSNNCICGTTGKLNKDATTPNLKDTSSSIKYTIDKSFGDADTSTRKYVIDLDSLKNLGEDYKVDSMNNYCKNFCNGIGLNYTAGWERSDRWNWSKFWFVPYIACFCDKTAYKAV